MLNVNAMVSDMMPVADVAVARNHNFVVRGEDLIRQHVEVSGPRLKNYE